MQIHQSAEDYLECILKLSKERPVVRSIDIANDMNYSKTKYQCCHEKSAFKRLYQRG